MAQSDIFKTGNSFEKYYRSINSNYLKVFNKHLMLHYPFFKQKGESLEERQINLTNYCVSKLSSIKDKTILEVGCGNGTQSLYIASNYHPAETIGIDLNPENIELAIKLNQNGSRVIFYVDDAHTLKKISDKSIDTLFCIESAFHYPEKEAFLFQVQRVLKPGGEFLIADILSKKHKKRFLIRNWKKKMSFYHWTEDRYRNSFKTVSLKIENAENITPYIIKGYTGYKNWISRDNCNSFIGYSLLQIFMFIQVNLNVTLLKRRRKYMIFSGKRS